MNFDAQSEVEDILSTNEDDGGQPARMNSDENDGDQPARRRVYQRADSSSSDEETAAPAVGGTAKHPLAID